MRRSVNSWFRSPSTLEVTWSTLTWWRVWTSLCWRRWAYLLYTITLLFMMKVPTNLKSTKHSFIRDPICPCNCKRWKSNLNLVLWKEETILILLIYKLYHAVKPSRKQCRVITNATLVPSVNTSGILVYNHFYHMFTFISSGYHPWDKFFIFYHCYDVTMDYCWDDVRIFYM